MNPSTAQATVLVDELIRCGLQEAVVAPGSRSAALALALFAASTAGASTAGASTAAASTAGASTTAAAAGGGRPGRPLRLHVRVDERAASFLALGLAKASGRPVAVVCTSGTAAAHLHAAVIEADEAAVPLLVLTADRPPELRGTGASQTIDQIKLYGGAVRWFAEAGVAEARPGQAAYWRSLACRAWGAAAGAAGGLPGPVHLNLPFREPLVPDAGDAAASAPGGPGGGPGGADPRADGAGRWPESLDGRPGGGPWTSFAPPPATAAGIIELPWTERGVVVCGDGSYDPAPLVELAAAAGWPLLAEPSSNARRGPSAVPAYQYLLDAPAFTAAHRPDVIVTAGRPGLSRGQLAFLRRGGDGRPARHIVLAQGGGRWADPVRGATDVTGAIRLTGAAPDGAGPDGAGPDGAGPEGAGPEGAAGPDGRGSGPRPGAGPWLAGWLAAGAAAQRAADELLDRAGDLTEPRLARDLGAALPDGALLWAASSLPVRDLDRHLPPRPGLRVLASRGASGIDGLVSSAIGAALAHQAAGGGPAAALLGDLALLHDAPGLVLGPDEPRPDLCLIVVNNDGGGIFSTLEQAALPGPFERVFGTPHGSDLGRLAAAFGVPHARISRAAELPGALSGAGLRLLEIRADRGEGTALRAALAAVTAAAVAQEMRTRGSSIA